MRRARTQPIVVDPPWDGPVAISQAMRARLDARYARMQSRAARDAMEAAFDATPAELGETAVAAARRRP